MGSPSQPNHAEEVLFETPQRPRLSMGVPQQQPYQEPPQLFDASPQRRLSVPDRSALHCSTGFPALCDASTSIDMRLVLPLPSGNREPPDAWTIRELGKKFGSHGLQFLSQQLGLPSSEAQQLYINACIQLHGARICHDA